jgi:hypothetical protein
MDYSAEVRRRLGSLAGAGVLEAGASGVVSGAGEDRALGAWVRFELQVLEGTVRQACFQAFGCPHTIAAASWVAEHLAGQECEVLGRPFARELMGVLAVPTEKFGKLLLIEDALAGCAAALNSQLEKDA